MKAVKSLVPVALLCCCLTLSFASPDKETIKLQDGLSVDTVSRDRVDGYFYCPARKLGIVFNSTRGTLLVTNLNGEVLIGAREKVGQTRLLGVGRRQFLQHANVQDGTLTDLSIPKAHGVFSPVGDPSLYHSLLPQLQKVDKATHARVLTKSVKNLLTKPELKLLKEAAFKLGDLGVNGVDYPSILPFHMTALQMESRDHWKTIPKPQQETFYHRQLKRSVCTQSCPPCKEQECLGMCGPGCSCWKFACGDCCFHKGCYYHDACCRSHPSSTACLMPLDFTCTRKYKCSSN